LMRSIVFVVLLTAGVASAQNPTVAPGTSLPAAPSPSDDQPLLDPVTAPRPSIRYELLPLPRDFTELVRPSGVKPGIVTPVPVIKPILVPAAKRTQTTGSIVPTGGIGADTYGQSVSRPDAFIGGPQYGPGVRPDMGIGGARPVAMRLANDPNP